MTLNPFYGYYGHNGVSFSLLPCRPLPQPHTCTLLRSFMRVCVCVCVRARACTLSHAGARTHMHRHTARLLAS